MTDFIRRRYNLLLRRRTQSEIRQRKIALEHLEVFESRCAKLAQRVLNTRFGRGIPGASSQDADAMSLFQQTCRQMAAEKARCSRQKHIFTLGHLRVASSGLIHRPNSDYKIAESIPSCDAIPPGLFE